MVTRFTPVFRRPSASLPWRRLSMALCSLLWRVLSHVTRWPSGWNVDRQKRDCDDHDRIKRDFRDVETPTPPLLYSLLIHGRSPSVDRRADLRTISVPANG